MDSHSITTPLNPVPAPLMRGDSCPPVVPQTPPVLGALVHRETSTFLLQEDGSGAPCPCLFWIGEQSGGRVSPGGKV